MKLSHYRKTVAAKIAKLPRYRKTVAAALVAAGIIATALSDGKVSADEATEIVMAIAGVYAVWRVRNAPSNSGPRVLSRPPGDR